MMRKMMTATEQRGRPRANRAEDWNRRPPAWKAEMCLEQECSASTRLEEPAGVPGSWEPKILREGVTPFSMDAHRCGPTPADAEIRAPGRTRELED